MYTKPYITDLTTCQDENACSHQIVEPLKWSLEYFYIIFFGKSVFIICMRFFSLSIVVYSTITLLCLVVAVFLLMYCYYSLVANSMLICENINNKTDIGIFDRKLCGFIFRLKFVSNFKFSYECVFFVLSEQAEWQRSKLNAWYMDVFYLC